MAANSSIRVWVRSLGQSCRVRMESVEQARWVLERLEQKKALQGLREVEIHATEGGCQFEIPNASRGALATLESALGEIPEVDLMLSPEAT